MTESSPGRRVLGVLLATTMALAACTSGDEAPSAIQTPPSTSPSPSPSPTPTLDPVAGERRTAVRLASANDDVGFGADPEPNMAMIEGTFDQIGDWLDAHLDRLQRTGMGHFGAIAAKGLASGDARDPVTTHLASPDHPVRAARYDMTAFHAGRPTMVSVRVTVAHPESEATRAELGFVVAEDGTPIMMMFAPVPVESG